MLDTPRSPFLTKAANINEQTSSTTQAKVMELLSRSVEFLKCSPRGGSAQARRVAARRPPGLPRAS